MFADERELTERAGVLRGQRTSRDASIATLPATYVDDLLRRCEPLPIQNRLEEVRAQLFSSLSMLGNGITIHKHFGERSLRRLVSPMTVVGRRSCEISAPWFALEAMYQSGPRVELSRTTVGDTLRDAEVLFDALCPIAIQLFPEAESRQVVANLKLLVASVS